jgi:membrane fusion protein (multidrug efflux system)
MKKTLLTLLLLMSPIISQADTPKMPAPKADIYIVPEAKALPVMLKYPAEIKSFKNVTVVSRVLGVLEKKHFIEGQKVKKGDLLYEIENDSYLAKVNAAKASLNMSQAALNNATKNWQRMKKLFLSKAVSEEKRDNSFSEYERLSAASSLAKAQLHQAQIDLNYTQVKAPISGTTGLKQIDVGDLVSSNPPTKLINISQNEKVYVEFSMPMSDYKNIKNNLWIFPKDAKIKISLEIDNKLSDKTGTVDFMDVNVNQNTATVKIRAIFDNSDEYLMPGSFVRVVMNDIVQKNVITIPQKAVLQNPLGTIVFVEDHGHVAVKPVVLGEETGDKYIVSGGGLKSGDKVIVNNFFRLKPGGEVIVDKTINEKGN